MKTCTKCKETKPLEEFHICNRSKTGRRSACKSCCNDSNRKYRQKNPEKVKEKDRKYRQKNPEKERERGRKYRQKNLEKCRERQRKWVKANPERVRKMTRKYCQENPEKRAAHEAKRRAQKLQATPHWLTEYQHKQIELKYWISQFLTDYTGTQHHVDHIHPLQGKNICGLHVPENLQILTAEENLRKSNSH